MSIKFDVILCQDINGGIGKDGEMAWNVPEEAAFLKEVTTWTQDPVKKNVVIMGRKTWESLPGKSRPLPDRYNVVLTRDKTATQSILDSGAIVVETGFDAALKAVAEFADLGRVYIIGGKELYEEAFNHPDLNLIHLSVLYKDYQCDTFLELPQPLEELAHAKHVEFVNYVLRRA